MMSKGLRAEALAARRRLRCKIVIDPAQAAVINGAFPSGRTPLQRAKSVSLRSWIGRRGIGGLSSCSALAFGP